ncbi:MAG: NADH-quinone oxidoreductase subunit L, partial [Pseudobdellovibrionaceae bacterium]
MSHQLLISTLILSPLIGFLINGLRYKRHSANVAGGVATAAAAISFLSAILIFMELLAMPKEGRQIAVNFFEWMTVASLKIKMGFLVDPLNVIMILIITG